MFTHDVPKDIEVMENGINAALHMSMESMNNHIDAVGTEENP